MRALLVGADRLGNIPGVLAEHGISVIAHVSGRNPSHQRRLPDTGREADLLILFTDFLGHNVMKQFRDMAVRHGIRVLACRRSVACLVRGLAGLGLPRPGGCRSACGLFCGRA